jgi:xylan 1,4-beta-xylosidase
MKIIQIIILLIGLCRASVFAANEPVVLEAESASRGADYALGADETVQYVYPKTTNSNSNSYPGTVDKVLTFTVTFTEAGTYDLYARLRVGAGSYGDDSFFFGKTFGSSSVTDASSWVMINGIVSNGYVSDDDVVGSLGSAGIQTWKWLNVSEFVSSTAPVTFTVSSAPFTYTFQVASREDGLDLDKIAFCRADYQYTVKNLDHQESGSDPSFYYRHPETYVNPVLPGDHPDPSLLKVGDDFYASGSCFHFNPYSPIMHSRDLVHWEILSRVLSSTWSGLLSGAPAAGVWGGTLSYFYGSYWYYFSNTAGGGQYFCKATSPRGPWSTPVKVNTTSETGAIGYDNSIFVDDDGTPYMLIKPGQFVNRIQRIGTDGHLAGSVMNLDWVNTGKKYSWAEGPVMCKRNGWYYYFIAGNVAGGQYVLRSKSLTSDSLSWEAMGNFFETVTDAKVMLRNPNHIAQPFMLSDSTWWTISHSYENLGSDSWDGKGRQGLLHQIIWDANGKPTGKAPTTQPAIRPALTHSDIAWRLPRSDSFDSDTLSLAWHFLHQSSAAKYSLKTKPGWLALLPSADSCHLLQKDAGHYYSLVTKVLVNAQKNGEAAGLYLTNGNMSKSVQLTTGYRDGKKLTLSFLSGLQEVTNTFGDTIWLKLERKEHLVYGYFGTDGLNWTALGDPVDVQALDQSQDGYNSWVGNSQGLFAKGRTAYFDHFSYRDGFSALALAGIENQYGVEVVSKTVGKALSNTSSLGGWFMLGGVSVGRSDQKATQVEISASSSQGGTLEIWRDNLDSNGTKLAEMAIASTGSTDAWKTFYADIPETFGQHDLFFRFNGPPNAFYLHTVRFLPNLASGLSASTSSTGTFRLYPNPSSDEFQVAFSGVMHPVAYRITTVDGRILERGMLDESAAVGRKLPAGAYLLHWSDNGHTHSFKILKK